MRKVYLFIVLTIFFNPISFSQKISGSEIGQDRIEELLGDQNPSLFAGSNLAKNAILFNDTISNNISYGKENINPSNIITAAKAANIHDFIISLKDGYNTVIGERGARLSGGQKQRISIARAILKNPLILIFDEATSSLDSESEQKVQIAINNLVKDRTVIMIAHRLSTIKNADNILVFDNGEIKEEGNHNKLIKNI